MLSYQHAYHAGNPADLHKHIVLAELLTFLTQKNRPITYVETHAGRALYDTASAEAQKTGEVDFGVNAVDWGTETPFEKALAATRNAHGPTSYPGSPRIALEVLRPEDRVVLMELHPQESTALATQLGATRAQVHHRDGYEGVLALAPMRPRKGIVLIDPSYEVKTEYDQVAAFVPKLLNKWREATVVVWYPILPAARHKSMVQKLSALDHFRDEVSFQAKRDEGMKASGLMLLNAPFGSEVCFEVAHKLAGDAIKPVEA